MRCCKPFLSEGNEIRWLNQHPEYTETDAELYEDFVPGWYVDPGMHHAFLVWDIPIRCCPWCGALLPDKNPEDPIGNAITGATAESPEINAPEEIPGDQDCPVIF